MKDRLREACGIFGIYGHPEASKITYLGLYALQHRGQESAGIVSSDGKQLYIHKQMGLVADVFNKHILEGLPGTSAIGHVRYSTTGTSTLENAQPLLVNYTRGSMAIAHNGNLVNAHELRVRLESRGSIFQSTMDTEVIIHLFATSRAKGFINRIVDALFHIKGAYSLLFLTENKLIAVRDPHGFRPLAIGKLRNAYVIASETCAFDLIEASFIREVDPGEIVVLDKNGIQFYKPFKVIKKTQCIFEYIYFSRPDSVVFGKNIYLVRKELGKQLAREQPTDADIVVPVPDSGVPAAIGYCEESGIPFQMGIIRNHYVGRTFIEPEQSIRHFGVKVKLNAVKEIIGGKRIVLIDDSIVRGTTGRKIVKMVRNAGAKEVHVRISSPPIHYPCYYGIDTPTRRELIASSHTIDEICKYLTADSLGYLSIEGLRQAVKDVDNEFCYACFRGDYPVEFPRSDFVAQGSIFDSE